MIFHRKENQALVRSHSFAWVIKIAWKMLTKICKTCGREKPLSEFAKSTVNALGCIPHCKECKNWAHRSDKSKQRELEKREFNLLGVKRCACCSEVKSITEFPNSKNRPDGLHPYCFICSRKKGLEYVNRSEVRQHKKERESTREFLDNLAEYRKNSEKYKETIKTYRGTSPVYKEYRTEYYQLPNVRVRHNISTRIWQELHLYNLTKKSSFDEYLGCSIEFFFNYLKSKFTDGMTWDNWGRGHDKWHADHITACAEFDMSNEDEVKKCFHYSNYQPLWEPENLRKSSKNADGKKVYKRYKK